MNAEYGPAKSGMKQMRPREKRDETNVECGIRKDSSFFLVLLFSFLFVSVAYPQATDTAVISAQPDSSVLQTMYSPASRVERYEGLTGRHAVVSAENKKAVDDI